MTLRDDQTRGPGARRGRGVDEERFGYGARPGWRAEKGDHAHKGRRAQRDADRPPASAEADVEPEADDPGALDLALRAAREELGEARASADAARREADDQTRRRARDAERARTAVSRARDRERHQAEKATAEQSERQRLSGALERATGELAQLRAELGRHRTAHRSAADRGGGDHGRRALDERGAALAGLRARTADLEAQLQRRTRALEALTVRSESAEADRDRLRAQARRLRRLALEAGAPDVDLVDVEDAEPLTADDLPAVRTPLQAVELAAGHAEHLVYTERAFATARTAPYDEPRKLLRDLVALDRVAGAWQTPGGVGRSIYEVAREEQLDWADDVSLAARHQHPNEYSFAHDGRPLWVGAHVRVATGRGSRRTCRVYLTLVKGDEPDLAGLPRGIYVGPVGRHLRDSTSG